ncbi:Hypothetical protein BIBO1_0908 [Brucella inopinata BO1]|uniref:chromosomal replication initiator protein DnaA n=1 Tax=Brucella phage BiPBO1 TaxID=1718278 RepID=UPI0001E1643E|nr:hypothetical protein [Brucella inopinata]YP_009304105.1 chromosomal replication initiator protein DnaA [Brucella phage BiPBO1]ALJ98291.1 chromosomal replication initiator protein DnaA [Brucella phage BiPBO1]EFM57051.1 Hypothetical protein BIBO1_0908 [Brucella inopinata BO1]KEY04136.1 hypothetical protein IL59_0212070 [Brucella suis bv. 4 str. 40]
MQTDRPTHKLCIDPSMNAGYCLLVHDEDKPESERRTQRERLFYGSWDLTRDRDGNKCSRHGDYYLNLWDNVIKLLRKHDIFDSKDVEIILEAEAYGAARSEASARLSGGWIATVSMIAARRGFPLPRTVNTVSWRSFFIGVTQAPKSVTDGLEGPKKTGKARQWLKDQAVAACKARGFETIDDNAAEAIGILFWALNGGIIRQEKSRAAKKAKTKAKRAQTKMNLRVAA